MYQAEGGRIIRNNVANANIGSTFSCSLAHAFREDHGGNQKVADRIDVFLNRFFIEPVLGMRYPTDKFKTIKRIYKYVKEDDEEKLKFNYDFIGIQNYTRVVTKRNAIIPIIGGTKVHPKKRGVEMTEMGWEVYLEGIYEQLMRFSRYEGVDKIIVTENGVAFSGYS